VVAGARIQFAVKSWVQVGIGDVEDFAAPGDVARYTPTEWKSDLAPLLPMRIQGPDLFLIIDSTPEANNARGSFRPALGSSKRASFGHGSSAAFAFVRRIE